MDQSDDWNNFPNEWLIIVLLVLLVYVIVVIIILPLVHLCNPPPKQQQQTSTMEEDGGVPVNEDLENSSTQNGRWTNSEAIGWSAAVIVLCILFGITILCIIAFLVLRTVEQKYLFVPHVTSAYRKIHGNWIGLRSGGGLLHCTPHANPSNRPLLFLHGNTGNLDLYEAALKRCGQMGYNIYALEYAGYGIATNNKDRKNPDCKSVIQDVLEAWDVCGDSECIVMGFSLGGAILGKIYDHLKPMPAQLVFLNTFHSIAGLIQSKYQIIGPMLTPLLKTQWSTQPPKYYHNEVLVVYTKDDDVVTPEQGKELCKIFETLSPVCVELPDGGHRYSTIRHLDQWANSTYLLPPFTEETMAAHISSG